MSSSLYLLDPRNGTLKKLAMPGSEIAGAFTFSKDFKQIAYRGAGSNEYAEIYASAVGEGSPKQKRRGSNTNERSKNTVKIPGEPSPTALA